MAGLKRAAKLSHLDITLPELENAPDVPGSTSSEGSTRAWLGHRRVLYYFVTHFPENSTALILEDDADWDVRIHRTMAAVSLAVRDLTEETLSPRAGLSYGTAWDLLWLGHCGDNIPSSRIVSFPDITAPLRSQFNGWNPAIQQLPEHTRLVHYSDGPICTYAYAVTHSAAWRILDYPIQGEAYDVRLSVGCREDLRCITVNPEIFQEHRPLGNDSTSDVNITNIGVSLEEEDLRTA